jgi:hypothetical protein
MAISPQVSRQRKIARQPAGLARADAYRNHVRLASGSQP